MSKRLKEVEIKEYSGFEEAVSSLIKKDKDYILIKHVLKEGEEIRPHFHRLANEWVLINQGKIEVMIDDKQFEVAAGGKYAVVPFPKGKKHSLAAKTGIEYFVLRDKKDGIVYLRRSK